MIDFETALFLISVALSWGGIMFYVGLRFGENRK